MSIRPSERKESAYSTVESPPTDLELKTKEAKAIYLFMLIFVGIDYFLSVLIIIKESYFFRNDKDNDITLFLIKTISITVFFLFIIISLVFFNLKLTKIIRYFYIIIVILYYVFEIFLNIKNFVTNFKDSDWMDILFFLFVLLTIIPRLFFFYNIDLLIIKINEIEDCKKGEEHDNFRENLENKMERGEDTNWSKTSLPSERKQQSQFLSGGANNKINKSYNDGNVYTIKENYIEEEQDNENDKDENNIDNENND